MLKCGKSVMQNEVKLVVSDVKSPLLLKYWLNDLNNFIILVILWRRLVLEVKFLIFFSRQSNFHGILCIAKLCSNIMLFYKLATFCCFSEF